jgi:hypothetical protein
MDTGKKFDEWSRGCWQNRIFKEQFFVLLYLMLSLISFYYLVGLNNIPCNAQKPFIKVSKQNIMTDFQ